MDIACPICFDTYNDKDKIPRILQCGHTFCQNCLMDLRTSNILTCPTCRKYFSPDVKQLIKNFTILDYLYQHKDQMDSMVTNEETYSEKYCLKHPQKKTKYFCENDQINVCSKCIVTDHKSHRISDKDESQFQQTFAKKSQILIKKIDASTSETNMFDEELNEISEQLKSTKESTLQELDEKLELLIEMLKNRKDTLAKAVKHHYKKQEIYLMEAQKNIERRKNNLDKLNQKLQTLVKGGAQNESKLERLEEEFTSINRQYDSPFHQFKHCTVGLNPQVVNQMFESIGNLKYPMVQFSNKNTYKFFNNKFKACSKSYFFGDSNNQELILQYDFYKDTWGKKEVLFLQNKILQVPKNLVLQSYSVAIGLNDGCILITGGLNSSFTNVSGQVYMYNTENETCTEKASLMQSRYTHALAHQSNYVYAIGGRSINGVLDICERYSINLNRWEKIAKLNQKRCTAPAVVFEDSYIYVFGGYEGSGRIDTIEQYDVTNDNWTILPIKFPLSIEAETATLISSNEVVILGGHDNSAGTKDAMILNLETLAFIKLAPMPFARFLHSANYFNNHIYVFGGVDNCSCQKMNVNDFQWTPVNSYKDFINYNLQTFSSASV